MERYILRTWYGEAPELLGPYASDRERDVYARGLWSEDGDENLIVALDLNRNGWQHVQWTWTQEYLACDEDDNCAEGDDYEDCEARDIDEDDCFVSCCDAYGFTYDGEGNHLGQVVS